MLRRNRHSLYTGKHFHHDEHRSELKVNPGMFSTCTSYKLLVLALFFVIVIYSRRGSVHDSTSIAWPQRITGKDVYTMYDDMSQFRTRFDTLSSLVSRQDIVQQPRVCIATFSLIGPTKNGGIATAYTALAETLVSSGHSVTVLYLWGKTVQSGSFEKWKSFYASKNIDLVPLIPSRKYPLSVAAKSKYVRISYDTYEWLQARQHDIDIIHFHEWHGPGYYTALAKHQGLDFHNTAIVTTIHCPSLFFLSGSSILLSSMNYFVSDFLERKQVEYSDAVISPSKYMYEWVQKNGWTLPRHSFVQPNLLPQSVFEYRNALDARGRNTRVKLSELVFFGRIEVLKGADVFCAALDALVLKNQWPILDSGEPLGITFLGNSNLGKGKPAKEYITTRATNGNWPVLPNVITDLLQPEAIGYMLGRDGRVAIMPSLHENSPYVVLECITLGIPFLASDSGGTSELIIPEDRDKVLFKPKVLDSIIASILHASVNGVTTAHPSFNADQNHHIWRSAHDSLVKISRTVIPVDQLSPLVSVCLIHHNRGEILKHTITGLLQQTYTNYELILVDDGSDDQEALRYLDETLSFLRTRIGFSGLVRVNSIFKDNGFPGAARNTAVSAASGEYVVFLDDDDVPREDWLSTLVQVALLTKADIVTSLCNFFEGNGGPSVPSLTWVPLGSAVDLGMFENVFGVYSALVKRDSFLRIGGFSEDVGSTFEDYEFFANAILNGCTLEMIPRALLWYRQNPGNHLMKDTSRYDNRMRALRPYVDSIPPSLRNSLLFAYGQVKTAKSNNK